MNERRLTIIKRTEIILLAVTITLSSVVSLLDFFGLLETSGIKDRIPSLTLLTVGLLAGYILIERRSKLEAINDQIQDLSRTSGASVQRIIESLDGVEVISFENQLSCLQHVNQLMRSATKKIDDLTWAPALAISDGLEPITVENLKYRDRMLVTAKKLPYREVYIFNRGDRKEKLFDLLLSNALGYSCAYYETAGEVPLLQFMIVDEEEVIVLTGDYAYLAFKHAKLVRLFREYYEDIWRRSSKLKIGRNVYWNEIEKVFGVEKTDILRAQLKNARAAN